MKIMLDTNVLISILIFDSKTLKNMLVNLTDKHSLILSSYVIEELHNVIYRKFPNRIYDLDIFLYNLPFEIFYTPKTLLNKIIQIRDKKDIPDLNSAMMADVDIFITGDKDSEDIILSKPKILTPTEFIQKFKIY